MDMKNKLIICCASLFLIGCVPPTKQEITKMQDENQNNIKDPQLIATTQQGNLYLIFIRPFPRNENHYDRVYFFDTNATVSVNTEVRHGKIDVTESSVFINGKEYILKR